MTGRGIIGIIKLQAGGVFLYAVKGDKFMVGLLLAIGENIATVHIVLFVVGIICLIAEMFEPGFGIFGTLGIVLMIIDVLILADNLAQGLILIAGVVLLLLLFVLIMFILASNGVLPKKLVLSDDVGRVSGNTPVSGVNVGDVGVAKTLLRPAGKAEIYGSVYDVISDGEFIEKDSEIAVKSVSNNKIIVVKK